MIFFAVFLYFRCFIHHLTLERLTAAEPFPQYIIIFLVVLHKALTLNPLLKTVPKEQERQGKLKLNMAFYKKNKQTKSPQLEEEFSIFGVG